MNEIDVKQKFEHFKTFTQKTISEMDNYFNWKISKNADTVQYKDYILFNQLKDLFAKMIDNYNLLDKVKQNKIIDAVEEKDKAVTELENLLQILFINNPTEYLNTVKTLKNPALVERNNHVFKLYNKLHIEKGFNLIDE